MTPSDQVGLTKVIAYKDVDISVCCQKMKLTTIDRIITVRRRMI